MSTCEIAVVFLGTVGVSVITLVVGALMLEEFYRSLQRIRARSDKGPLTSRSAPSRVTLVQMSPRCGVWCLNGHEVVRHTTS